jgi:hypothetical protein
MNQNRLFFKYGRFKLRSEGGFIQLGFGRLHNRPGRGRIFTVQNPRPKNRPFWIHQKRTLQRGGQDATIFELLNFFTVTVAKVLFNGALVLPAIWLVARACGGAFDRLETILQCRAALEFFLQIIRNQVLTLCTQWHKQNDYYCIQKDTKKTK